MKTTGEILIEICHALYHHYRMLGLVNEDDLDRVAYRRVEVVLIDKYRNVKQEEWSLEHSRQTNDIVIEAYLSLFEGKLG